MAKSYIPEIARMLGVEIGERFKIIPKVAGMATPETEFFFGDICLFREVTECGPRSDDHMLRHLISGDAEIVKKPWKPEHGGQYWTVTLSQLQKGCVVGCNWWHTDSDIYRYRLGNCYRTREEAEADREKWERFYADDSRINWEEGTTHE